LPIPKIEEFVHKWKLATLTETSGSQSHFIELCEALGEPTPTGIDVTGEKYTFEKGCKKLGSGEGWADVWYKDHFAWEYKGKHKDLAAAYKQLIDYYQDLENPPLLVVSDMALFEVHTNFNYTKPEVFKFSLDDLLHNVVSATCAIPPIEVLRALFENTGRLRPGYVDPGVTEEAAKQFAKLGDSLRQRHSPEVAAHFLMRLLFCLFADGIGLLPDRVFSALVSKSREDATNFSAKLCQLFVAMAEKGGHFGVHDIDYFNGGLFSDDNVLQLTPGELQILAAAATLNWAKVEPAIFGTLFERTLNPEKRTQVGTHYTSRDLPPIFSPRIMRLSPRFVRPAETA
jgi:hypothetical protein